MAKGKISVQTENIFPIIKKFLYSDHEIFLRELISNAIDATQKLRALASKGEFKGELGDLTIEVKIDKKHKTLHIIDKGVGMTEEEVKKYINQIALSSASDFLEKYKDETQIIGNFGLGFYSSFMVSDRVEIKTFSWQEEAKAVKWSCDGSPEYAISKDNKTNRGTEIILHINDENKEFLEEYRIRELLDKYCKFLPIPIKFGTHEDTEKDKEGKETKKTVDTIINNTSPAWTKAPKDLKDEDYLSFYNELYPMSEPPLFWIHLNVDYPFNLTGILYFPKLSKTMEVQKNKIQLYCNQVFVTNEVNEIVPEWLTLLHGVIDSPDIPLNVSRSYLQSDPNVKKINSYITKKVADKLSELFKNDRKVFEEKWEHIGPFIKYGMLSDEKFYEKAEKFCLFQDTDENFMTTEELEKNIKEKQTDKDGNLVILYTSDKDKQYTYITSAKANGYKVIMLDTLIDSHFISGIERKKDKWNFKRVDADTLDKLIEKDEEKTSLLTEKEEEKVKSLFEGIIEDEQIKCELKSLDVNDQPVILTQSEFGRRMKEMSQMGGGGMSFMGNMPDEYNLVINTNHPILQTLLRAKSKEKKEKIGRQLYDIALLSQNLLKGKKMTEFINRSVDLIK
jgi:molecular chaperone HtpG